MPRAPARARPEGQPSTAAARAAARCAAGRLLAAVAGAALCIAPPPSAAQISPLEQSQIRASIANRIEALTILGGDFGFNDGNFTSNGVILPGQRADTRMSITKIGGAGDIGDPQPLGDWPVGWQPHLQGSMGYLDSRNTLHSALLEGDRTELEAEAIEFGGGVRLWFNDSLSVAPTFMGLYGRTSNTYSPESAFARANFDQLRELGLIDWRIDVWSLRPAVNFQYLIRLDRWILTLSSDVAYFRTRSFGSSGSSVGVNGDSGFVTNKIDLDVPLGVALAGHELRTGGYLSRTDLSGSLDSGLGIPHLSEVHGRVVLDFLDQWWKFQWIGFGASYLWGPNFRGWTAGVDLALRF